MNLENIILSERRQSQKKIHYMIPFIWNVQNKQIYRDQKYISSCLGLSGDWGGDSLRDVGFFGAGWCENVLTLIMVMVAQTCEYTKKHLIVKSKQVNCMVCELYINKAVTKKKIIIQQFKT